MFILSHMPFIFKSNSEDCFKICWFLMKLWRKISWGLFHFHTVYLQQNYMAQWLWYQRISYSTSGPVAEMDDPSSAGTPSRYLPKSPRPIQSPALSGMGHEYRSVALWLESRGRHGSPNWCFYTSFSLLLYSRFWISLYCIYTSSFLQLFAWVLRSHCSRSNHEASAFAFCL